jgi:hypothetical protein
LIGSGTPADLHPITVNVETSKTTAAERPGFIVVSSKKAAQDGGLPHEGTANGACITRTRNLQRFFAIAIIVIIVGLLMYDSKGKESLTGADGADSFVSYGLAGRRASVDGEFRRLDSSI